MPTLRTDVGLIEYAAVGSGPTIVAVHSAPGTAAQWTRLAEDLKDTYRILAVNLRGIGMTERWSGDRALSIDDDAEVVRELITSCGAPVHLLGHSYGGAVCIRVALRTDLAVRSLTLIEPMVYPLLRTLGERELFAEAVGPVQAFLAARTPEAARLAWQDGTDRYHGPGTWTSLPESARATLVARTPIVVERCHALLSNPTEPDTLRTLKVRTLVVCGADTHTPERRLTEIVASLIPSCAFRSISGAGHMSPLTHPVHVAAAIRAHFLEA